ncbi:MAG: UDP-glucose dehydrogenase family protein [Candidatus Kerfeldbacteria bacterium]|jgi:UDPglucose 6-dehydrogenase
MEKISIIGSGYVGLVTGACFVKFGNKVIFNDIDQQMLDNLMIGKLPIHEEGLAELLTEGISKNLVEVTTDKKYAIDNSDVVILCLPTPPKKDGNADLKFIREVSKEISKLMSEYKIIINKSTAPVGTSKLIREIMRHYYSDKFDVISIPEFLQEGKAVETSLNADRQVIGFEDDASQELINRITKLFNSFNSKIVITDNKTAEFAKYACNSFLALEISYINSLSSICEKLNINILDISKIMKLDTRIGKKAFLNPGPGFGGMCFPKDVLSIVGISDRFGYTNKLLQVVSEINHRQRLNVAAKVNLFVENINNPKISILGLSFKKNTSDVRDSQSKTVIEKLIKDGYKNIIVYDPISMDNFKKYNLNIKYATSAKEALKNSDCMVIMTEWDEFEALDINTTKEIMNSLNIVDTRNLLNIKEVKQLGFNYIGTGIK